MAAAQLRHSLFPSSPISLIRRRAPIPLPRLPSSPISLIRGRAPLPLSSSGGGDVRIPPGGRGGGRNWGSGDNSSPDGDSDASGPLDFLLAGWRARVSADPQFPFKVLMEQLVGVTACVLGDMASRPNFGLNELDFVFSTLVVGSILNFLLMYLLAPTTLAGTTSATLRALPSYMFEPGAYSLLSRIGTFVTKGVTFAAVGFGAGIAGTAISNGLMAVRKRMDPGFETPNEPPPTVLNAMTWATHMGLSSNLRYQTLNGVEFVLEKALPPAGFKSAVVVLRVLNNVLGGVSFVALARLTGSQKAAVKGDGEGEVKERLIGDRAAVDVEAAVKAEVEDEELRRAESKK